MRGLCIYMVNLLNNSKNRNYLISVLLDNIGSSLITFILPLLILDITSSTINLSIVSAISILPFLILGLPFGAMVDKFNIKKILYLSDFIRFLCYIVLSMVLIVNPNKFFIIIVIYVISIIVSCTNVMNSISELTFISYFVNEEDLTVMNSQIYGIQYVIGMIIPVIGGFLYSCISVSSIFLCSSIFFLMSSLIIFTLDIETNFKKVEKQRNFSEIIRETVIDIEEGLIYVKKKREVFIPLVIVAVFNILVVNFQNDSLIIFKKILKFTSGEIGIIYSITSIGALLGTIIVSRLTAKYLFNKLLFFNIVIQFFLRLLFVFSSRYIMLAAIVFLIDICQSVLNIIIITNRQQKVSKAYLGRVNSIYKTVLIGINSLGYIYGGALTSTFGAKNGILISTMLIIILIIGSFVSMFKKGA